MPNLSDIRIRLEDKKLSAIVEKLMTHFSESTGSKAITRALFRYVEIERIIAEQREEIANLAVIVRWYEQKHSGADAIFKSLIEAAKIHLQEATKLQTRYADKSRPPKSKKPVKAKGSALQPTFFKY